MVFKVANKQCMVIMKESDIFQLSEIDMKKLKNNKVMNPHCFVSLLSNVCSHIVVVRRHNITLRKLFEESDT